MSTCGVWAERPPLSREARMSGHAAPASVRLRCRLAPSPFSPVLLHPPAPSLSLCQPGFGEAPSLPRG